MGLLDRLDRKKQTTALEKAKAKKNFYFVLQKDGDSEAVGSFQEAKEIAKDWIQNEYIDAEEVSIIEISGYKVFKFKQGDVKVYEERK